MTRPEKAANTKFKPRIKKRVAGVVLIKKKDRECPLDLLMQDGSLSPIVCLGLAQRTEHGRKPFQSFSRCNQHEVRRERRDAESLSAGGGDQSWPASEGFGEGEVLLQGKELLGGGRGGGGGLFHWQPPQHC